MYKQTETYSTARKIRSTPNFWAFILSDRAQRVYGTSFPSPEIMGTEGGVHYWDGTYIVGDGSTFGSIPVIDFGTRLLRIGSHRETLAPNTKDLIASFSQTQLGSIRITLDNQNGHFSTMLGDDKNETFLLQILGLYQGFPGCVFKDLQRFFYGEIVELQLTSKQLILLAEAI